jgi:hypothetical protein
MKAYRIAISDQSNTCVNCADGLPDFADYCSSCQRVYIGKVDFRSDYADHTVGWRKNYDEAFLLASRLIGY